MRDREPGGSVEPAAEGKVRVNAGGRSFLVASTCPHRDGLLLYGYVNPARLRITCPLHRSSFDLVTGAVVMGPSEGALETEELPCRYP
ncbi:MAG: Rieske (2Fe-2S) protein [Solirubrobacteraceae bacterium]